MFSIPADLSTLSLPALPPWALPVGIAVVAYGARKIWMIGSREKGLPPGPPTVPVLGNLNVLPREYLHLKFTEWAKQYGDAFSLKILNQTIIVLNTPSMMKEVIDKRSASSSNRPKSILADMITPKNMNMGTGRFANNTWKVLRRATTQLLNTDSLKKLQPNQHAEAAQLMWDLAHDPDNWYTHIQRYTTSFALSIVYGKRAPRVTSPDAADFLHVHPRFMHALEFGTMPPVDLFPILTLVPERFAKWKRTVKEIRHLHESLYDRLLKDIESRLEKGQGTGIFMEQAVENAAEWGLDSRELVMHLGGVLLEGSDTTSATLQNLVLAFISFPEVQKKAREELDRVVGIERAPTFDDLPNLPYTMAIIQEANRFLPIGPLGLPHEMNQDEIVDGVLFPKDAVVFVNLWHIFHDERYYDKPYEFIPERFLKHPLGIKEGIEDDPARRPNLLFGGGRRVCPGIVFANTSLEINVANFLWGFEFLPSIDPATGKPKMPSMNDYTTGITAVPRPVKIRVRVRSPAHKDVIDSQFTAVGDILATCERELTKEDRKFNETYRDKI